MKRISILLLLIITFFYSCADKKTTVYMKIATLHVPQEESVDYFRSHFKLENIIPIETNDSFLISRIDKVIRLKDKFLLFSDKDRIVALINGRNGQQELYLHRIGNGPGEWSNICDVAFDELSNHILIFNDSKKLLSFDLQGRFVSEVQVDALYDCMTCERGEVIFYNRSGGYSCYPYIFKVYNLKQKQWRDISYNDKIVDFPIRYKGRQMVKSKRLWINAPLDFTLYYYQNDSLVPYYQLDISKAQLTDNLFKKATKAPLEFLKEVRKEKITYSINSVRETTNHLVFHSSEERFFLLNKEEGKIYSDNFLWSDACNLTPNAYFPHDGDDNCIMFIITAERWAEQMALQRQFPNEWQKFTKGINISADNNPILVFFSEK